MKTIAIQVEGMTCGACAKNVEKALSNIPGASRVNVSLGTGVCSLQFDGDSEQPLLDALKKAGYSGRVKQPDSLPDEDTAARRELFKLGAIGLLLLTGWAAGKWAWLPPAVGTGMVVAGMVWAAWPICFRAVKALWKRHLDADVLVGIAVIAAASVGEFVAAGEVAFIMLLGAQLEEYTTRRAKRSLGSLLSLVPATARVRRDGVEMEIPAGDVRVGEIMVVRAGERIPADGVVKSGRAAVNQAPVTGESMPVEKNAGDDVYVGTLNESGALIVEATRVGGDTTLARIADLVEAAQRREAPVQRTMDKFAAWLVPVMLTASVLVYVFTQDLHRAITVLIVACPCALVLASPTAVMAAIGRAAKAGVLIKGGQHLESAAKLHTIVFDKTGTLTHGRPEVQHVQRFCDHSESEMVGLAAVAEKMSTHPVARAIMRRAESLGVTAADPVNFQSHHGRGVSAEHNGQRLVVGQRALMADHAVEMTESLRTHIAEHHDEGHTTVMVAHDGKVCGTICVSDTVRAKADEAIANLRKLGIEKVVMLTGDNQRVAMRIGGDLGVDEVKAEVLPEQKAQHIETLKAGRPGVAMVGDGINDAPALAVADVGIAMGVTGTDVAHEAADIALMADDLSKISFAVGLSRQALSIIRQGLYFSLIYNSVMVFSAAEGHLGMIGGAIAHQISSVLVILNAMRLLRYRG
jgi:Cd2+/Zn2+-exporting ATPase